MTNKVIPLFKEPWKNEPDKFDIEKDGYHLFVYRHPHLGTLNGYVGVTRQHPWFGLHYDDRKTWDIRVHGGLTYSGKGYWHGTKKKYWYFGFDTAHAFDLVPSFLELNKKMEEEFGIKMPSFSMFGDAPRDTYKNIDYVTEETEKLYEQLKAVKEANPNYEFNFRKEYKRLGKIKKQEIKRKMEWKKLAKGNL